MRRAIKVYVSTGRDLARERDVIGRVVAELPVTAGWEIGATPASSCRCRRGADNRHACLVVPDVLQFNALRVDLWRAKVNEVLR
jgi:hypothetical protein